MITRPWPCGPGSSCSHGTSSSPVLSCDKADCETQPFNSRDFHRSLRLVLTKSRWERRSLQGRKPELFLKLFSSLKDNLSYLVMLQEEGVGEKYFGEYMACLIYGVAKISDWNRPSWCWVPSPGLMGKLFPFSGHWHTALTLLWAPHDAFLNQQNKPYWMAFSDSCIWNSAHGMFQSYGFLFN